LSHELYWPGAQRIIRREMFVSFLVIILFNRTSSFSLKSGTGKQDVPVLSLSFDVDDNQNFERHKRKLGGKVPILSRTIPIETDNIPNITIWELEKPSQLMEMWWQAEAESSFVTKKKIGDPFGVVMVCVS
jgi:hypothetical protein